MCCAVNHVDTLFSSYFVIVIQQTHFHEIKLCHDEAILLCKHMVTFATLRDKRVPKQCPWCTIAKNGTLLSKGHVYEKKGKGAIYNITDSQIVLLLFRYSFFSE